MRKMTADEAIDFLAEFGEEELKKAGKSNKKEELFDADLIVSMRLKNCSAE
jgi:hypothetical protein